MKQYEAPRVTAIGTVADLTKGTNQHNFLDADFPANTPHDDLTFS
jgi:hypothetical protein